MSHPKHLPDHRAIPLFQGIADDAAIARILAACPRIALADGERLIEAGRENHSLYILLAGRMEARLSEEADEEGMAIAPGEPIGEMSILDGRGTSAHVYSVGDSEVLAIAENDFWEKLAVFPEVMRNLTRLVTQRMRANSERMVRALEEHLEYQHLRRELASAHTIQMGLLPRRPLLPNHPQVDIHAVLTPAKEVGGDLYDAFPVDDEHILLAVGDVSGKGMPAALFMMRTLTLLRAQVHQGLPGDDFLAVLNRLLCEGNEANMFVTLSVGLFSVRSGRLVLFNGGHPPPMLSRNGEPFEALTGARGALLGMMPGVDYRNLEIVLAPGDRVVFYTDGVTEAENPGQDMFGQERLQAALTEAGSGTPMKALIDRLTGSMSRHVAGAEQSDDITILALHYLGHPDAATAR